jgi:hypothetical protein
MKTTKRGDRSYWQGNRFIGYTLRHRLRLLIGVLGQMQTGEYLYRRVRYGSLLHRLLNAAGERQPPANKEKL